jgi:hypothetical protein
VRGASESFHICRIFCRRRPLRCKAWQQGASGPCGKIASAEHQGSNGVKSKSDSSQRGLWTFDRRAATKRATAVQCEGVSRQNLVRVENAAIPLVPRIEKRAWTRVSVALRSAKVLFRRGPGHIRHTYIRIGKSWSESGSPIVTMMQPPDLGGLTLSPGVYSVPAGTTNLSGVLTLDDKGVGGSRFVFQLSSTLITSPNSSIDVS